MRLRHRHRRIPRPEPGERYRYERPVGSIVSAYAFRWGSKPVRFTVAIKPVVPSAELSVVRTTVEAPDEATALSQAEAAYRRMHPSATELTLTVENTFEADG